MHLHVEKHQASTAAEMAIDVARHLYPRYRLGKTIVIAEQPLTFMRLVRRQWVKVVQTLQRERASTIDALLIAELSRQISAAEEVQFAAKGGKKYSDPKVYFASPDDQNLPGLELCRTLFVSAPLTETQQRSFISPLKEGVIVTYPEMLSKFQ